MNFNLGIKDISAFDAAGVWFLTLWLVEFNDGRRIIQVDDTDDGQPFLCEQFQRIYE